MEVRSKFRVKHVHLSPSFCPIFLGTLTEIDPMGRCTKLATEHTAGLGGNGKSNGKTNTRIEAKNRPHSKQKAFNSII